MCPDFFGDWTCEGRLWDSENRVYVGCDSFGIETHDPQFHWGYQHWIWFIGMFAIACVNIASLFNLKNDEDAN